MADLLFTGVGLALTAGAVGMLAYKATTNQALCSGETPQLLCAGQYLSVLAVLLLWLSSILCSSKVLTGVLSMMADLLLGAVVVSLVTTDADSFVDFQEPQRIVGNMLVLVLAMWRLSMRINELVTPATPVYQYY